MPASRLHLRWVYVQPNVQATVNRDAALTTDHSPRAQHNENALVPRSTNIITASTMQPNPKASTAQAPAMYDNGQRSNALLTPIANFPEPALPQHPAPDRTTAQKIAKGGIGLRQHISRTRGKKVIPIPIKQWLGGQGDSYDNDPRATASDCTMSDSSTGCGWGDALPFIASLGRYVALANDENDSEQSEVETRSAGEQTEQSLAVVSPHDLHGIGQFSACKRSLEDNDGTAPIISSSKRRRTTPTHTGPKWIYKQRLRLLNWYYTDDADDTDDSDRESEEVDVWRAFSSLNETTQVSFVWLCIEVFAVSSVETLKEANQETFWTRVEHRFEDYTGIEMKRLDEVLDRLKAEWRSATDKWDDHTADLSPMAQAMREWSALDTRFPAMQLRVGRCNDLKWRQESLSMRLLMQEEESRLQSIRSNKSDSHQWIQYGVHYQRFSQFSATAGTIVRDSCPDFAGRLRLRDHMLKQEKGARRRFLEEYGIPLSNRAIEDLADDERVALFLANEPNAIPASHENAGTTSRSQDLAMVLDIYLERGRNSLKEEHSKLYEDLRNASTKSEVLTNIVDTKSTWRIWSNRLRSYMSRLLGARQSLNTCDTELLSALSACSFLLEESKSVTIVPLEMLTLLIRAEMNWQEELNSPEVVRDSDQELADKVHCEVIRRTRLEPGIFQSTNWKSFDEAVAFAKAYMQSNGHAREVAQRMSNITLRSETWRQDWQDQTESAREDFGSVQANIDDQYLHWNTHGMTLDFAADSLLSSAKDLCELDNRLPIDIMRLVAALESSEYPPEDAANKAWDMMRRVVEFFETQMPADPTTSHAVDQQRRSNRTVEIDETLRYGHARLLGHVAAVVA